MPIELPDEHKQALVDLTPTLQEIEAELKRAEQAGINVSRMRQSFQIVVQQHQGLIANYVNNQAANRRRVQ